MAFSIFGILAVVLEVVRPLLGWLVLVLVLDLTLLGLAWRDPARPRWWPAVRASFISGLALSVLAFVALPTLTGASFDDLAGALDYFALIGLSMGFGGALALLSYPGWQLYYRD